MKFAYFQDKKYVIKLNLMHLQIYDLQNVSNLTDLNDFLVLK